MGISLKPKDPMLPLPLWYLIYEAKYFLSVRTYVHVYSSMCSTSSQCLDVCNSRRTQFYVLVYNSILTRVLVSLFALFCSRQSGVRSVYGAQEACEWKHVRPPTSAIIVQQRAGSQQSCGKQQLTQLWLFLLLNLLFVCLISPRGIYSRGAEIYINVLLFLGLSLSLCDAIFESLTCLVTQVVPDFQTSKDSLIV